MNVRTFRPRYLWRRLAQRSFERRHPTAPWLCQNAVYFLDAWLRPTDDGFEWGSGRSTVWFARRCARVCSVEHNAKWHAVVAARLAAEGLSGKVVYRLVPCDHDEVDEPQDHAYAHVIEEYPENSFDWVLVDGNIRLTCLRAATKRVRPGGLLILDNANRYVPNFVDGDFATVHEGRGEPRTPGWTQALRELEQWRAVLTSDGIWDTRFWQKPA